MYVVFTVLSLTPNYIIRIVHYFGRYWLPSNEFNFYNFVITYQIIRSS